MTTNSRQSCFATLFVLCACLQSRAAEPDVSQAQAERTGSLVAFAQEEQRAVAEIKDSRGRSWTILQVKQDKCAGYFVANDKGELVVAALVFGGSDDGESAVVLAEQSGKRQSLAVLDKDFLSGIENSSESYKKWSAEIAAFTYGSVQLTQRTESKGALSSSDVRVEGGKIVGQISRVKCNCTEMRPTPKCLDHGQRQCDDAWCAVVNCVLDWSRGWPNCAEAVSNKLSKCDAVGLSPLADR